MERQEIEQNILKKLHEIWDLYKKYDPDGIYLSLFVSKGESETTFATNNDYWEEDRDHAVNHMEFEKEN